MRLSILDQAPISNGQTPKDVLDTAVELAQFGDKLGYERFWVAEHHDLFGLACPNPEVMISAIGAQTSSIRIGAGAVLLPYYKPFRVAETYNLLATLYPGRIDLGIGRAPGGSAEVSLALSDNYLKGVRNYPQKLDELLTFLYGKFPEDHIYHSITASPKPAEAPETWLLGTSEKSALLAAEKGLDYAFGYFMSDADGVSIVRTYREKLEEKQQRRGKVIVAVHVICAATSEEAEQLASSYSMWKLRQTSKVTSLKVPSVKEVLASQILQEERKSLEKMRRRIVIGSPQEVKSELENIQAEYTADELMVVTIVHDEMKKQNSYRLLKEAW